MEPKPTETIKNNVSMGGPMPILEIELSKIDTEGQSVREAQDDDHVVELAMSIAKHGLLQPIIVEPKEDGRYQLEAGFHRLAAVHRLGRQTIMAHVRTENTGPVKAIALVENICRKDMSLNEEVQAVNYLNKEENLSISQICDISGKSTAWVQKRLMIPSLPEHIQEELMDGTISIGHAEIIGGVEDWAVRNILLNQVVNQKLTVRQTADLAALYDKTPSIPEAIEAGTKASEAIQTTQETYRGCYTCKDVYRLAELQYVQICVNCSRFFIANRIDHSEPKEKDSGS